jgi:hypothetical protein
MPDKEMSSGEGRERRFIIEVGCEELGWWRER